MSTVGEQFAEALAAKDEARMRDLLGPEVDFKALTPRRHWDAESPDEVIEILFGTWFELGDHIDELLGVETGAVVDREYVSYRLSVRKDEGPHEVEQQAYLTAEDGRINWMRVLCSGVRPV
jgi:hypothetical protein